MKCNLIAITILVSLNLGCGKPKLGHVDSALMPHVQSFKLECERARHAECNIKFITITFMKTETPTWAGSCTKTSYSNGTTELVITINRTIFNSRTLMGREALIMHELGHCYLGLEHNDLKFSDGSYKSVMSTRLIEQAVYERARSYYIDELFNRASHD